MDENIKNNESVDKRAAIKLILLTMAVYMVSYFGRKSYDSNINEVMSFYGVEKTAAGLVGTCFFIVYAIGQIVHGILSKRYNPKYSIFIATMVASVCNILMAVMPQSGFEYLKFIWIVNGFAMASLWAPMISMLNRVLAFKHIRTALFCMSLPVSLGTFITYGTSALFSFLGKFKLTFYIASGLLFVISFIWLFSCTNLIKKCEKERDQVDGPISVQIENGVKEKRNKVAKSFFVLFAVLAVCAICDNFLKDGLSTWTPTILKEKYGLENWVSVLLTILLPCFAVFGSWISINLNKKIKNYVFMNAIFFLSALIVLGILVALLDSGSWVIVLILFIIIMCIMSAINNVLTNIFPMKCDRSMNVGLIAGLIDGFCYVGSAASSFGLGAVAEGYGWNTVMYIFLIISACALTLCLGCTVVQKIKSNKNKVL